MENAFTLSDAYNCEDTMQFLGETLACYNKMMDKDIITASLQSSMAEYSTYRFCSLMDSMSIVKHRSGSWSDSGCSYGKSESDYSCYSSLSFGENDSNAGRISGRNFETKIGELSVILSQEEKTKIDNVNNYIEENMLDKTHGEDASGVFEQGDYSPEEIKILQELMDNPDNKYETTKALSDICRIIPSKRNRLTPGKLKKSFKGLCQKISGSIKKIGRDKLQAEPIEERQQLKSPELTNKEQCKNKDEQKKLKSFERVGREPQRLKTSTRNLFRSVRSPKRDKKEKKISLFRKPAKEIPRASSYSSLFGRRGSLFSQTERSENVYAVRRSLSASSFRYDERSIFNTTYDQMQNDEFLDEELPIRLAKDICDRSKNHIISHNFCCPSCCNGKSCYYCREDDKMYPSYPPESGENYGDQSCNETLFCNEFCYDSVFDSKYQNDKLVNEHSVKKNQSVNEDTVFAPLNVNVLQRRSAVRRKLTKLRDII